MDKNFDKTYSIPLGKLKNGQNQLTFDLNKAFVSHFEHAPMNNCEGTAVLNIDKHDDYLTVRFDIKGKMELECDRCLDLFFYPFEAQTQVIYAFEKELDFEENDEVQYINPNTAEILIGNDLYDFVCLAIPYRKTHEDANETCPEEVMKLLGLQDGDAQNETENEEAEIDPRWEKLKKLK